MKAQIFVFLNYIKKTEVFGEKVISLGCIIALSPDVQGIISLTSLLSGYFT